MSMLSDNTGKTSMMRVSVMMTLVIGSVMALAGTIFLYIGVNGAETLIVSGPTLMGASGFAKAFQATSENKVAAGEFYEEHDYEG